MEQLRRFKNRRQAGLLLSERIDAYAGRGDVIVVALPRGGVPVGFAVTQALHVAFDILLVRKLGVPGQEEYAMGAVASGGLCVLQPEVLRSLQIPQQIVDAATERELREIERREKLYRANHPMQDVQGRVVVLVDDGMATGTTMFAAIEVLRAAKPARIVVAVPVAAPSTLEAIRPHVDELICLLAPPTFRAVGQWYEDFEQTSDAEVQRLLEKAHVRPSPALPVERPSRPQR